MNKHRPPQLSSQGWRRHNEMLDILQQTVVKQRRQRQNRRVAGVVVLIIVANLSGWLIWSSGQNDVLPHVIKGLPTQPMASSPFDPTNVLVAKRAGIVDRYLVATGKINRQHLNFETVSDDQLLQLLSDAGHPSVLGKIGGQLVVLSTSQKPPASKPAVN